MIVWILKVRTKDEYDTSMTFSSKEEAQEYINRTFRHYLIPVRAKLELALVDKD